MTYVAVLKRESVRLTETVYVGEADPPVVGEIGVVGDSLGLDHEPCEVGLVIEIGGVEVGE